MGALLVGMVSCFEKMVPRAWARPRVHAPDVRTNMCVYRERASQCERSPLASPVNTCIACAQWVSKGAQYCTALGPLSTARCWPLPSATRAPVHKAHVVDDGMHRPRTGERARAERHQTVHKAHRLCTGEGCCWGTSLPRPCGGGGGVGGVQSLDASPSCRGMAWAGSPSGVPARSIKTSKIGDMTPAVLGSPKQSGGKATQHSPAPDHEGGGGGVTKVGRVWDGAGGLGPKRCPAPAPYAEGPPVMRCNPESCT